MRRVLSPPLLAGIAGRRVAAAELLPDGYRNSNFKLRFDDVADNVRAPHLRARPGAMPEELDLYRLLAGAVPLPEVIRAEPAGIKHVPPFLLLWYIEGLSCRELRRRGDAAAVAKAARSAGETPAAIGRVTFSRPGWIESGPTATAPLLPGPDPIPRFVDRCLASPVLQARMPAELRRRTSGRVWSSAAEIAPLDRETRLVHGDFNKRNLIVKEVAGRWMVAAVLDWEFAVSGSPLMDIGNFLRYDVPGRPQAEPHFSSGYVAAGGVLPTDWRRLARLVDLTALCGLLAEEDTPEAVVAEVVELLSAT
jgi:aminoglycoside phosphotransferase (APT) family kinase protein